MYGALSSAEFAISIWPMMADISQKQILKKKKTGSSPELCETQHRISHHLLNSCMTLVLCLQFER